MVSGDIGFLDVQAPRVVFRRDLDHDEFERFLAYASENTGYTIAGVDKVLFLARAGTAKSDSLRARYIVVDEANRRRVFVSPELRRDDKGVVVKGMCFYNSPGYDVEDQSFDSPLTFLGLRGEYNKDPRDPLRVADGMEAQAGHYFLTRAVAS